MHTPHLGRFRALVLAAIDAGEVTMDRAPHQPPDATEPPPRVARWGALERDVTPQVEWLVGHGYAAEAPTGGHRHPVRITTTGRAALASCPTEN